MIKSLSILISALALSMFLSGCTSISKTEQASIQLARAMILNGRAECVLIIDGKIAITESGHGVSPLLDLYDKHGSKMKGGIIVDKVIGRAAAAIAICGQVAYVHGEVMSEDAVPFLESNGVGASGTLMVPRILNQKRNGICPLEQSVEGITNPKEALKALRAKISSLQSGN